MGEENRVEWADSFNTPIPEDKFWEFMRWMQEESSIKGRDMFREMDVYDFPGYWANIKKHTEPTEHYPDTYKKPYHPTFSDESIYHGKAGLIGGHWEENEKKWTFKPGRTNLGFHGKKGIVDYLRNEPDVTINW